MIERGRLGSLQLASSSARGEWKKAVYDIPVCALEVGAVGKILRWETRMRVGITRGRDVPYMIVW